MYKIEDSTIGQALQILSLIGLFNIIGVLIMGYLSDKYSKKMSYLDYIFLEQYL